MLSLSHEEFQKSIVKDGGFEVYTQEQFNTWIEDNMEVLQKGEANTLEEFEKSEYETLKEELKSFTQVEVILPSQESQFRIEKSIMYIRPNQVEWDEPEIIKGEDGEDIQKARGGRYTNTPTNRKLGRVGQKYGGEKKEEESKPEGKITMNNLDWGKTTFERNSNLDKYESLKTEEEKENFKKKLKGISNSTDNKGKSENKESDKIKSSVYEIKIGRKWSKIRATSMKALSDWAKENNVSDWRMVGMMSNTELKDSQSLEVVA